MVYRAIGLMSGSSLDGLDIVFAELQENGGKWTYDILQADCYDYPVEWVERLKQATSLTALQYQLLHVEYGRYLGQQVNRFIDQYQLNYQVALVASHGHTTFHLPAQQMTAQLGDGSAIAALTHLPVVSDLRALDVALGGQGAPIVPIGEKLLLPDYQYFLNLGGIANISVKAEPFLAFDICPANRVLNMLATDAGQDFDDEGKMASSGTVDAQLLERLNSMDYYQSPPPKSLANDFGTQIIYPLVRKMTGTIPDALRTYTEHISIQVENAVLATRTGAGSARQDMHAKLLCTGGGAFNSFLLARITDRLRASNIEVIVPNEKMVNYKEALVMALVGVLRWREEANVLASVTGACRDSVGGALWMGQED